MLFSYFIKEFYQKYDAFALSALLLLLVYL